MEFAQLVGNDALKQRLSAAARQGRLSHCWLICGPHGSGKHTLFTELAAYFQCTGAKRPCGRCSQCRKVRQGTHPDILVVDEDKKNISVETVRQACASAYVRPNEGARKLFLFPRAQALGPAGQNALLKVMEEPPGTAAFFLLCENAELLLPTVRSRCVQLNLAPLERPVFEAALRRACPEVGTVDELFLRSGGFLGQAIELARDEQTVSAEPFARALANRDGGLSMLQLLSSMERLPRETFAATMLQWERLLCQALAGQDGPAALAAENRTPAELSQAADLVRQAYVYSQSNVGVGHLCGMLAAVLVR